MKKSDEYRNIASKSFNIACWSMGSVLLIPFALWKAGVEFTNVPENIFLAGLASLFFLSLGSMTTAAYHQGRANLSDTIDRVCNESGQRKLACLRLK